MILADYTALCDLLGPLNFDTFCAGYVEHSAWLWKRARGTGPPASAVLLRSRCGGERGHASYTP